VAWRHLPRDPPPNQGLEKKIAARTSPLKSGKTKNGFTKGWGGTGEGKLVHGTGSEVRFFGGGAARHIWKRFFKTGTEFVAN